MDGHPRSLNRRTLISAFVAAGALCAVWLLPSAYAEGEAPSGTGTVLPVDEPHGLERDQ